MSEQAVKKITPVDRREGDLRRLEMLQALAIEYKVPPILRRVDVSLFRDRPVGTYGNSQLTDLGISLVIKDGFLRLSDFLTYADCVSDQGTFVRKVFVLRVQAKVRQLIRTFKERLTPPNEDPPTLRYEDLDNWLKVHESQIKNVRLMAVDRDTGKRYPIVNVELVIQSTEKYVALGYDSI